MKYHFRVSPLDDGRFLVQCVEMFFCSTCVERIDEAPQAARVKLHKYLSEPSPDYLFAVPTSETLDELATYYARGPFNVVAVFSIPIRPRTAFAISIRRLRSHLGFNQTKMAHLLGMQSQSAYQRLEDPSRTNPTLEMIERVRTVLPELNIASLFEPTSLPIELRPVIRDRDFVPRW